jgi:Uma2 family endonuclease
MMTIEAFVLASVQGGIPLHFPARRVQRMGMAAPVYYTAEMVRAMPEDGNRYGVVYGELLVTPAPRLWHQVVVQRLSVALDLYLRNEPVGVVLSSPADISWGPDVLVQPDVYVATLDEIRTLTWSRVQTLLLVAEVLSPSSSRGDRILKRIRYRQAGVPLYWVVDGDEMLVEVWTPSDDFPRIQRQRLVWNPSGAREPFILSLEELFRPL